VSWKAEVGRWAKMGPKNYKKFSSPNLVSELPAGRKWEWLEEWVTRQGSQERRFPFFPLLSLYGLTGTPRKVEFSLYIFAPLLLEPSSSTRTSPDERANPVLRRSRTNSWLFIYLPLHNTVMFGIAR